MTEINNNIHNYEIQGMDKVKERKNINKQQGVQANEAEAEKYVADTGVLGRSQIRSKKGADVSQSVDEAVAMAQKEPVLLKASESLFDNIYQNYLKSGIDPSEAYIKSLLAEEEFIKIGKAHLL